MQNETQTPHEILPEEDLSHPYQVIAHFFDYGGVSSHRRDITTWMEAVNKSDYWRESCPSDLLYYQERLVILIKAVHIIYKEQEGKERKTAIDLLEGKGYEVKKSLLHPALYVGWTRNHTLWNYFPRSLSREEYIDPYLVFPEFFALYDLQEWCHELHELLSEGLSSDNAAEAYGPEYDMLLIQKNLLKLVEAAHLIDVREVDHIGDFKKRPPYTLDEPLNDIAPDKIFGMILPEDDSNIAMLLEEDDEDDNENDDGYDDESENRDNEEENEDEDGGDDNEDDMDNDEETGQEHDERPTQVPGQAFVEVMIRGNCLVNDRPVGMEPVKINIPIKVSDD